MTKIPEIPRNTLLFALTGILILVVALGWYFFLYSRQAELPLDTALKQAFSKISDVRSYAQYIETQIAFPDRHLNIEGIYMVDSQRQSYASVATTTLYIRSEPRGHKFTLQNISIREDVFAKVETTDPLLSKTIQHGTTWQHFKSTSIPKSYESIAVSGPIQDNIQILGDGGVWLKLTTKHGKESWGDIEYLRYTFKLAEKKLPKDGALRAMLERIGSGSVDVWIDQATHLPGYIHFSNPPYFSTTTIYLINALPLITAPSDKSL